MIQFEKIYGKNVNSFEEFELIIQPGRHLIIGKNLSDPTADSNGSGKSSISECLDWVLFKDSPKGEDISRDWKGNCQGSVFFSQDNRKYEVRRYGKDKFNGNKSMLIEDGEDISPRLSSLTDSEIIKKIGFDYDLASMTVTVLQGLPSNFSTLSPTVRKQVVENMLRFTTWDDIKSIIDSFIKSTNSKQDEKSKKFTRERENLISINSRLETLKRSGQEQKDKTLEEIKRVKQELRPIIEKMIELQQEKEKYPSMNSVREVLRMKEKSESYLSRRIDDLKNIINMRICPNCEQVYPLSRIQKAEEELTEASKKLDTILSEKSFNEKIKEHLDEIEREETKINSSRPILERQLSALVETLNQDETELSRLELEVSQLTNLVNEIKTELDEINRNLDYLRYISDLLKPASKFRASVLERYLGYVNQILEEVCKIILDNKSASLVISTDKRGAGVDLVVTRGEKKIPYKSLSGGEKRRVDIAIILSCQRFLLELHNISTNVLFFDEIMDTLDRRGIEIILNSFDSIFPPDIAIYVISHKDDFKQIFDDVIEIIKENDISRIV